MERNALPQKERFNAVDIAKFIMAFCVISIHTCYIFFENSIANAIFGSVLIRFAVPFFFVASGFFFFRDIVFENGRIKKCPENRARLFKFLKRTALLYILWAIIYFAFEAFTYIDAGLPVSALVKTYATTILTDGFSGQFWYLLFMIYSTVILYVLLRFIRIEITAAIIGVLFLLFLYYYTYRSRFQSDFLANILSPIMAIRFKSINMKFAMYLIYAALGFLFSGLLCVQLRNKISKRLSGILLLVSIILSLAENILMDIFLSEHLRIKSASYSLFLLPVAFFGFIFLSKLDVKGNPKIFTFLRSGSSFIYCSHILVLMIFNFLTDRAFVNKPVIFPIICGITLALTLIYVPLSGKIKFLKKLY